MDPLTLPADAASALRAYGPNCGVIAVAVAAGVSFQKSWDTFKTINGRSDRWRGVTYAHEHLAALRRLSVKYVRQRDGIGRTLAAFVRDHTNQTGTYFISTGRHVQIVRGGVVIDQRGPAPIAEYWGRNKRVKRALKIKRADAGQTDK